MPEAFRRRIGLPCGAVIRLSPRSLRHTACRPIERAAQRGDIGVLSSEATGGEAGPAPNALKASAKMMLALQPIGEKKKLLAETGGVSAILVSSSDADCGVSGSSAAGVVMGMEERQQLVAVHRIAGVVDIAGDGGGRGGERAAEDVDQGGRHARHLDARQRVLQAAHGGLGTECSAALRRPP